MKQDVRRALKELKTRKPPPPPPARARSDDLTTRLGPTLELSDRDIIRPSYGIDESIRIPKRRSILPWLFLVALAGVGVKAYLVCCPLRAQPTATDSPSSSALATPTAPTAAPDAALAGRALVDASAAKPHASASPHLPVRRPTRHGPFGVH